MAPSLVPNAYHELGNPANFGSIVELDPSELAAILDLTLRGVALDKQPAGLKVEAKSRYVDAAIPLKAEIYRMAALIAQRVAASQTQSTHRHPDREANPPLETQQMLFDKWEDQRGRCGLCHQPISVPSLA